VALALGDIGPTQVSRTLHDHAQAQLQAQSPPARNEPLARALQRERTDGRGSRVTVEGVGNLLSQLARCCEPMPGDPIVGYLTRGRGVSIHRRNCTAVQRLIAAEPDRALPVNWGQGANTRYEAGIQIRAFDRKSLLKDLTNVIAQSDAGILEISSRLDEAHGLADIRLRVRVTDFSQLSQLLARLDTVPGVQDARRLG